MFSAVYGILINMAPLLTYSVLRSKSDATTASIMLYIQLVSINSVKLKLFKDNVYIFYVIITMVFRFRCAGNSGNKENLEMTATSSIALCVKCMSALIFNILTHTFIWMPIKHAYLPTNWYRSFCTKILYFFQYSS